LTCIKWMFIYTIYVTCFNIRADLTLSYFVIIFCNYLQGLHVQFTLSSSKIHFSSTMRIHVMFHIPPETTWSILSIHGCCIFMCIFLHVQIPSSILRSKTHDKGWHQWQQPIFQHILRKKQRLFFVDCKGEKYLHWELIQMQARDSTSLLFWVMSSLYFHIPTYFHIFSLMNANHNLVQLLLWLCYILSYLITNKFSSVFTIS